MDEGGWGGAWGDITAAAEPATKTKAGRNSHSQPQAQTHNKDKNAKKEKKATFENDSKKNTDDPWGTNAGGWGGGGGWADEAPAAPTAADNDSKTANNAADDNAWGNGWDADDPWAQRDDAPGMHFLPVEITTLSQYPTLAPLQTSQQLLLTKRSLYP